MPAPRALIVLCASFCARSFGTRRRDSQFTVVACVRSPRIHLLFLVCDTELSSSSTLDSNRFGAPLLSALRSYRRGTASGQDSTRPLICMCAPRASASTSASSASVMIVASITDDDDKNCIDGRICFREPPPPVSSRFSRCGAASRSDSIRSDPIALHPMSSTALLLLQRQLHLYSYRIVSLICNLNVLVTPDESLSSEMFEGAAGAGRVF